MLGRAGALCSQPLAALAPHSLDAPPACHGRQRHSKSVAGCPSGAVCSTQHALNDAARSQPSWGAECGLPAQPHWVCIPETIAQRESRQHRHTAHSSMYTLQSSPSQSAGALGEREMQLRYRAHVAHVRRACACRFCRSQQQAVAQMCTHAAARWQVPGSHACMLPSLNPPWQPSVCDKECTWAHVPIQPGAL